MSALGRRGSSRRWRRLRRVVLERDGYSCQLDGCGAYADHVDHVTPRIAGGSDALENLRALCAFHNLSKGSRPEPGQRRQPPAERWSW